MAFDATGMQLHADRHVRVLSCVVLAQARIHLTLETLCCVLTDTCISCMAWPRH